MRTSYRAADAGGMSSAPLRTRSSIWGSAAFRRGLVLGTSIVLTTLTGLVIGWFAVAFQFFGETADAEDYEMATGAYSSAALLLSLGAVAACGWGAPRWQLLLALGSAGLLTILALDAASSIASADPGAGINSWIDGAGGVAACAWTWPLVVLGLWKGVTFCRVGRELLPVRR
jgi:hypothetical protein